MIEALAARFGGTAYAAVQLARALNVREDVDRVSVVTRRGSIVERGLKSDTSIDCLVPPEGSGSELARRVVWQARKLSDHVVQGNIDLVISMSGLLPAALPCKLVCLLFNPGMFEAGGLANMTRRWAARRTARRAELVAAPSRHMASLASASIHRQCVVVPLGIDHAVFTPSAERGGEILCVADFYTHKRHELLLDAWLALPEPRPPLRLIGDPAVDPDAYRRLTARLRSLPPDQNVILQHGVGLAELVEAYRRARIFVMPSERESFCMPLLEALSCGVPALVRDLASLRETGGEGARYLASDDPRVWSTQMQALLRDEGQHGRDREAAIRASAGFSWKRMARELLDRADPQQAPTLRGPALA